LLIEAVEVLRQSGLKANSSGNSTFFKIYSRRSPSIRSEEPKQVQNYNSILKNEKEENETEQEMATNCSTGKPLASVAVLQQRNGTRCRRRPCGSMMAAPRLRKTRRNRAAITGDGSAGTEPFRLWATAFSISG
jgi:hypothetical protein